MLNNVYNILMKEIIDTIKVKSYGKINLSLNIVGSALDLHLLDMVTASISLYDLVEISSGNFDSNLSYFVPNNCNTALKAAKAMCEAFSLPSVNVRIDKQIPLMAGMGGSSCDAAAVIAGLANYYKIEDKQKIKDIAQSIGSDVYFMISGGFQRVSGVGAEVKAITSKVCLNMLAVMGDNGVLARDSYKMYDVLKSQNVSDNFALEAALSCGNIDKVYAQIGNSLQEASMLLNSDIKKSLELVQLFKPKATVMFGSGAAVCGFFDTFEQAEAAEQKLKDKATFALAIRTVPQGTEVL